MKKAHELRIPFTWEERRAILLDRCLYIPGHLDDHAVWVPIPWEDPSMFGNNHPVTIEYCSGNGQWISEKAKQSPNQNWVAVEKRFDRARLIWARLHKEGLKNLLVVCGEAVAFSRYYVPLNSISRVFVNFPDPWPKLRHAKHRLIGDAFLKELEKVLIPGKTLVIATDDRPYVDRILEVMQRHPRWTPVFAHPYFVHEWEDFGVSFFSNLWTKKGLSTHYLQFTLVP